MMDFVGFEFLEGSGLQIIDLEEVLDNAGIILTFRCKY